MLRGQHFGVALGFIVRVQIEVCRLVDENLGVTTQAGPVAGRDIPDGWCDVAVVAGTVDPGLIDRLDDGAPVTAIDRDPSDSAHISVTQTGEPADVASDQIGMSRRVGDKQGHRRPRADHER